jgi:hypothetical protein
MPIRLVMAANSPSDALLVLLQVSEARWGLKVECQVAMPIGQYMTMPHDVSKHVQQSTGQALFCRPWRIIKRFQISKKI